jgi:TPP-dependent pyruvate/acetoin dehydrogenase alpha subunit
MGPERDPLAKARRRLLESGHDEPGVQAVEAHAVSIVAAWAEQARAAPMPDPARVKEDVFK